MTFSRLAAACLLALGGLSLPFPAGSRPVQDRTGVIDATVHEIQGSGLLSPLAGSEVMVSGVVTAKTALGYFIQTPDHAADALAETSEGLFVQVPELENGLVQPGDVVMVRGRVEEVLPYGYPHQLTVTQLVDVTSQVVVGSDALPAPIELDAADLSPDSDPTALERLEGMRVRAAELVVVGATQSVVRTDNQAVFPNGNFHAVLGTSIAFDALPFREPGLPPFTAEPLPAGKSPSFNDGNPQVLAVDGSGQRGSIHASLEVGLNDRVRDAVGVLDYRDARHALLLDAQRPIEVVPGYRGEGAAFNVPGEVKLVWMDLGGLYDASDDPARDEPVHAPAVYQARLAKIATGLCTFMLNPEVIAVGGVENVQVLQDLAALIETNPTTYCPEPRQYQAVLVEGSDASGLDLGFLVAGYTVDGLAPRVQVLAAETIAAADTSAHPDGGSEPLFTRPPLALALRVTDEAGRQAEFTAVNVRLHEGSASDSLSPGPNGWSTGGDRVMTLRARQAARIAAWIEDRQQADPNEAIAVLGGFEADAFNDGRVDVMGILTGRPAPANETWVAMPSPITTPLANLTELAPAYTRYTANDRGEFRALDHILANEALRRRFAVASAHPRMNADFPASARAAGDPGFTFSARDPLIARLAVAAFIDADTSVTLYSNGTYSPRVDNTLYLSVGNQGPDTAKALELVITSTLAPAQWSLSTSWPGWTCGAVAADGAGSRVSCSNPELGGDGHGFEISLPADPSLDGQSVDFTATLRGGHNDADLSNNTSSQTLVFDGRVDLQVELLSIGGVEDLFPGEPGGWVVIVNRSPLNPPGPVTMTLDIDALASDVGFTPGDSGVTCDAGTSTGPRRSRFTCSVTNDDFLQVAVFGVTFATGLLDGGRVTGLTVEAAASSPDPTPANNVASASHRVSDKVDLRLGTLLPSADTALLDSAPSVSFVVSNALRGVARNATLDVRVDLPPSALGELEPQVSGQTPAIWSCLPPQADGAGSRIACTVTAPMLQPEFPSYDYYFRLGITPPLRAGVPQYTVTTQVTVGSDSEEQVPADNSAQASFTVDQTVDLAVRVFPAGSVVVEPAEASFTLQVDSYGPNLPRNPRLRLVIDAALAPGDLRVRDAFGQAVACTADAAPAGSTAVICPVPAGSSGLTAYVRTNPAIALGGLLSLQATVANDLMDPVPANDTASGQVFVIAEADLCVGASCGPAPTPYPVKLDPGQANTLVFDLANLGPSTARSAVAIVEVLLQPARVEAAFNGQACAPAEAIGFGFSQVRCPLGDLPGNGARGQLSVGLDTEGLVGDQVQVRIRVESAVNDPRSENDQVNLTLPIAPIVDLSAQVAAKRTRFPAPAVFSITAAADGPETSALSQLVIRIESPGAGEYANLVMDGPGWLCSANIYLPDLQEWACSRYLPIASGSPSVIGVEVPAYRFIQSGRPILVTATHTYPAAAIAVDRTPGNDSATATHVVDGRTTQSTRPAPKPTPAYGARGSAAPEASRTPATRTATR